MTSFAFILGCVPLWIAEGSGAASRRMLGTVVISGMLAATLLAIFLIPDALRAGREARDLAVAVAGRRDDARAGTERVMRTTHAVAVVALSGLVTTGCLAGPNYEKPVLPTPEAIRGAEAATAGPAFGDAKWWEVFQDEQLQNLVKSALKSNEDVQIAATRVLQAQAQLGITRSDQYPSVGADGTGGGGRTPELGTTPARTAAALRVGAQRCLGARFLGPLPPRQRVGAGATAGDRVGPARGADHDRQPGGGQLLRPCARSICSSRSRSGRWPRVRSRCSSRACARAAA